MLDPHFAFAAHCLLDSCHLQKVPQNYICACAVHSNHWMVNDSNKEPFQLGQNRFTCLALGPDMENRKRTMGLTETDGNGNSISICDGNRISVSIHSGNAKSANLRFCPFWKHKIGKPPFLSIWEMQNWPTSISVRLRNAKLANLCFPLSQSQRILKPSVSVKWPSDV